MQSCTLYSIPAHWSWIWAWKAKSLNALAPHQWSANQGLRCYRRGGSKKQVWTTNIMFSNCLLSNDMLSCICTLYLIKRNVPLEQESKLYGGILCTMEWYSLKKKKKRWELFPFYLENKNAFWILSSLMISFRERLNNMLCWCSS